MMRISSIMRSVRPPPQNFTQFRPAAGVVPSIPAGALEGLEKKWDSLTIEDQHGLWKGIEEVQKKDWKLMTADEKKAAWFVSFGPYGPREPLVKPGDTRRMLTIVAGCILGTGLVFYAIRMSAPEPPHTMSKEYQEKMNEFERENNMNPITGISSKDYKGKGHVQFQ